ncbi:2577_t:CDS:1 [Dentiscutata heterogama]|uniref:2577_t:CDS:1 n=1 Tax=Dentiscutata heterogama TaxID=1316150 RepID=A0ACA9LVY8_9GLOM|nr:2577_t:CDS:1 [Dentiscutata heterogama]
MSRSVKFDGEDDVENTEEKEHNIEMDEYTAPNRYQNSANKNNTDEVKDLEDHWRIGIEAEKDAEKELSYVDECCRKVFRIEKNEQKGIETKRNKDKAFGQYQSSDTGNTFDFEWSLKTAKTSDANSY